MATPHHTLDDLVITFKPEATPEEEDRFLIELAHAILIFARHLIAQEDEAPGENEPEAIEF